MWSYTSLRTFRNIAIFFGNRNAFHEKNGLKKSIVYLKMENYSGSIRVRHPTYEVGTAPKLRENLSILLPEMVPVSPVTV